MLTHLLQVIRDAVPGAEVTPAPGRHCGEAVIYRWYPGADDGSLRTSRLELRVTAERLRTVLDDLAAIREAIVSDGDVGVVGEGAAALAVTESSEGGGSGYLTGPGLYYVKAGFRVRGRSDLYVS